MQVQELEAHQESQPKVNLQTMVEQTQALTLNWLWLFVFLWKKREHVKSNPMSSNNNNNLSLQLEVSNQFKFPQSNSQSLVMLIWVKTMKSLMKRLFFKEHCRCLLKKDRVQQKEVHQPHNNSLSLLINKMNSLTYYKIMNF